MEEKKRFLILFFPANLYAGFVNALWLEKAAHPTLVQSITIILVFQEEERNIFVI